MEEYLPGLVKVIEERLGKFGRPITTIVVICVALGTATWGIRLFWDNAVWPLVTLIDNWTSGQELAISPRQTY